jgi:serine/threonine protein kinase
MKVEIGAREAVARSVEWPGDRPLVVGRAPDVGLKIEDARLSRRHCQLEIRGGAVLVEDLGSANGTYVGGARIAGPTAVPFGGRIRIGRSWLRVVPDGIPPAALREADDSGSTAASFGRGAAPPAPSIAGYEVGPAIGQGSFGAVYRARRLADGREVAIKVLCTGPATKAKIVARFLREIEATRQLRHPNLVAVFEAGEREGFAFLVMELCPGDTLAKILGKTGRMPVRRALEVARGLAAALEHAFSRGFVHRDVKPENVLFDAQGTPKLCDFGLVKSLGASAYAGLTRPGQGFGSVAYMPPEQVGNAVNADQRADIYSVGATLYHMLTGRRPFGGKLTKGLLRRVLEEKPQPILALAPEVPPAVVALVDRCLEKDPAARFQTPAELRAAIEACLAAAREPLVPAAHPGEEERTPTVELGPLFGEEQTSAGASLLESAGGIFGRIWKFFVRR